MVEQAGSEGHGRSCSQDGVGLNYRAACDRLASENTDIKQLGVDQLLEMRNDGNLDDDQKRQLLGVIKYLQKANVARE